MTDKTRLELDIEQLEKLRTPVMVKIVIFFLLLCLCAVGAYTFSLKQELSAKEQEIVLMKEKIELLGRIKQLEDKHTP
jgi:hypothetical protein